MNDGLLEVVIETHDCKLVRFFGSLGRPHLSHFSGKEITAESIAPMPIEVNGEVTCH